MSDLETIAVKIDEGPVDGRWNEDAVKKAFESRNMTPDWAFEIIKQIAERGEKDRDRLRAVDMWGRYSGYKPPERVYVSAMKGLIFQIAGDEQDG